MSNPENRHPPPATLATFATLQVENSPTVAVVASVAGGQVPPDEVLILFERASVALMDRGLSRAEASIHAVDMVRADLRNDPRLADPLTNHGCVICGGADERHNVLLPVVSAHRGRFVLVHADCHVTYIARQTAKADACLRAAGLITGEGL